MVVVDVTRNVARTFGRLRAELRNKGITVADLELLIGSTGVSSFLALDTLP
ncbi:MAG: hypothetical protein ACPLXA_13665 [Moorellaceae bacterium]